MSVENISLVSRSAGELHARLWHASGDARGAVVFIHGLGDHIGRYSELAERLTDAGYYVLAFDLPGHGKSPGVQGRIDSYDDILKVIAKASVQLAEWFPELPQVVIGHSMGGNFALNYALRHHQFDGVKPSALVLVGPMLQPDKPLPRPQIFAAWLTGRVLPGLRVGKPVAIEQLTRDEALGQASREDPLTHSKISLYLATQLVAQGRFAIDHARELDVKTMIMFGEEDELIDRGACENVAVRIGDNATTRCWPAAKHDLIHEINRDEIIDSLIAWIDRAI